MRFLVDRCAGTLIADWLRTRGHDVVESRERGPDPGDRVILEWAGMGIKNAHQKFITSDTDWTIGFPQRAVTRWLDSFARCVLKRTSDNHQRPDRALSE
ncbi:MAG: hypothetical protein QOF62_2788 [Pyrinomonadaceae bacterium]|jgi:predicted nuclease of predicted toxin-antitoxin system|nr:hypothetical protein [Pyrinomonadaceae bacterium]